MTATATATSKLLTTPIKWAIGSWSFFIAENVILSENRTYIINDLLQGNDDYYHYVYGLCSTAATGSIAYAYYKQIVPFSLSAKHSDLLLWNAKKLNGIVPLQSRLLSFVTLSLGLGFLGQTLPKFQIPLEYSGGSSNSSSGGSSDNAKDMVATAITAEQNSDDDNDSGTKWKVRCPFDFSDSKSKYNNTKDDNDQPITMNDIHGMDRITRHPGLWSFGLISLGASFLSPCIPTRIYLSMPLVMSLIGGEHNDSRFRRNIGGYLSKDIDSLTSNVPFWALISGKQTNDTTSRIMLLSEFYEKEVKGLNFVLGMGLAALFVARKGRVGGIGGHFYANKSAYR